MSTFRDEAVQAIDEYIKWPTSEEAKKSVDEYYKLVQEAKKEADERVDNVYGYVIDNLRALALVHEADAAKVNIFDTERLTRLAKVKALREGAALVETFRERAAQTWEVSKQFRIDELNPNKLFPIESEAKSGALLTTTGWNLPDPFSEQNS